MAVCVDGVIGSSERISATVPCSSFRWAGIASRPGPRPLMSFKFTVAGLERPFWLIRTDTRDAIPGAYEGDDPHNSDVTRMRTLMRIEEPRHQVGWVKPSDDSFP